MLFWGGFAVGSGAQAQSSARGPVILSPEGTGVPQEVPAEERGVLDTLRSGTSSVSV